MVDPRWNSKINPLRISGGEYVIVCILTTCLPFWALANVNVLISNIQNFGLRRKTYGTNERTSHHAPYGIRLCLSLDDLIDLRGG